MRIENTYIGVDGVVEYNGQEGNIHPHRKRPVGERLAALARNRVYGREAVACYGPTLDRAAFEGDRVRLHFDHVHGGLVAKGDTLQGFTIAGEDRHFVWADAEIDGGTIVCRSPKVPAPTAVRYAMAEGCLFNLYNEAGLPAPPFRTDDWTVDLHPETPRRATAARAPAAPVIDGDLDEPAWEGAQPLTAFTLLHTRRPAAHPTEAHVVWDDQHLYVGLRCRQDPGQLRAEAETTDDKRIWQDDNVQVFLDVTADKTTYVRYAVNPAGVVAHGYGSNDTGPDNRFLALGILPHFRHFSTAWDSACEVATGREEDGWTVELGLPWRALGLDKPPAVGTRMGLQLTRTVAGVDERSEWTGTGRDRNTGAMMPYRHTGGCIQHHGVSRFGRLELGTPP